jgi:hypothetical protein
MCISNKNTPHVPCYYIISAAYALLSAFEVYATLQRSLGCLFQLIIQKQNPQT